MNDLKSIIAKNISDLRKESGITQLQLAEKLNYSDKAVSKWERGESVPDVSVLVAIAELFDVTLDYLVTETHEANAEEIARASEEKAKLKAATEKIINKNRKAITGIAIQAVWLVAIICFVPIALSYPEGNGKWLCFIGALPVSAIVWLVFNTLWFNKRMNYFIVSVLMWSILVCIHASVLLFGNDIRLIYLLGLSGQLIIILCSAIRKNPRASSKKP